MEEWRKQLVTRWDGLVLNLAHKIYGRTRPVPDDVLQEGRLGLVIAATRFDPERGVLFSTYATYWVRNQLLQQMVASKSAAHFGNSNDARRALFGMAKVRAKLGPDASWEQVATRLKVKEDVAQRIAAIAAGGDAEVDHKRHKVDEPDQEEVLGDEELVARRKRWLRAFCAKLPPLARQAFQLRHLGPRQLTLREVGEKIGRSRERVRQLEHKVLTRAAREAPAGLFLTPPKDRGMKFPRRAQ